MKTPKKISKETVDELMPRLHDEFLAFYAYRHLANWCLGEGYKVASEFFQKESDSELGHAKKIENYIVDWNVLPSLDKIDKADYEISSIGDCIDLAYKLEYDLYEAYEETSAKLLKMGDICAFDFLQFFRDVQRTSVIEYSDMLNMLKGVDVSDKFKMLKLEKKLFG